MATLALIWGHHYDDKPFTTHHTFWEATLHDRGVQFDRFSWSDWPRMRTNYDLYIFLDWHPSLYKLGREFHPRCFYWWDSFHHPITYAAQVAPLFDRAYFAERITTDQLQHLGMPGVHWLPPAFYPGCYKPSPIDPQQVLDFSFVGQPDDTVVRKGVTRKEFFTKLLATFPNSAIEQGIYGDAVNTIYNRSRILVDRTIWSNVGTRVFETIGSGGFALVNKSLRNGLDELAIAGHHFVYYDDSLEDCIEKMKWYLKNHRARERIADAGYLHFCKHHTYSNRLDTILKDFGLHEDILA
jgi:hypothetical protein